MEFTIEKIPVWDMCYLVNGDYSVITDEDKAMADEWRERNNVVSVSPASDDAGSSNPYFTHYPAFGLASDVIDCTVMVM